MHAGEASNGSDQRAHGGIFYAPSGETSMTAGIRYENARRQDENGSDQRAHGDIFYAGTVETTMTGGEME
ncbi:MAG: hypothetical protein ACLTXL_05695 [Clostridia bacterium]